MKKISAILLIVYSLALSGQSSEEAWIAANGYFMSENWENTAAQCDILLERGINKDGRVSYMRGMAAWNLGKPVEAGTYFDRALENGNYLGAYGLALLAVDREDPEYAFNMLDQFLKAEGGGALQMIRETNAFKGLYDDPRWYTLMERYPIPESGECKRQIEYLINKRRFDQARASVEHCRGIGKIADDPDRRMLSAMIYFAERQYQLALNEINGILTTQPGNIEALHLKAQCLAGMEKHEKVVEVCTTILENQPENFEARASRMESEMAVGTSIYLAEDSRLTRNYLSDPGSRLLACRAELALGNNINALKMVNRLIDEESPKAIYFKTRGLIYFDAKNYDQAAYDLSMSLDLAPNDAETNLKMGLSELRRGNSFLGCYYLQRAVDLGSTEANKLLDQHCH